MPDGFNTSEYRELRDENMRELFCCKCATKCITSMINGEMRENCPNCGFIYYRNPAPAVSVILIDGVKIALGKRSNSERWGLPCGYIEYGESFVDAAVREVKEEIGIDSQPLKIINVVSNSLFSKISSVVIVILSKPLSLKLTADGIETTDAQWFDIDSISELEFDADKYIIEKLKESLLSKIEISGILLSERQTSFIQL